jgi:hypothetical protein
MQAASNPSASTSRLAPERSVHHGGPGHIGELVGQGEATFLARRGFLARGDDLGIHQHHRLRLLIQANVDDDQAQQFAHLRRGEADAWRLVHRRQHLLGERGHARVAGRDRLRLRAQPRVGDIEDRKGFGVGHRGGPGGGDR